MSEDVNSPVCEDLRPGWFQCRIGPRTPKEGNGASMSTPITIYDVDGDAEEKDRSGGD